ncbi:hypothetical protein EJ03DRAFT_389010 [Teratosphaeria nubilosa]|uniref:Sterol 24-C-methyltransferase n=1 Tax=Teratosphaeria nubilosa TaxID=161662 RepID=A0A6G1LDD9_9PEZI|nr:hypothetical protein EJ03DRAFT_389010 [Teratosphaeria nubilosa]
MAIDGASSNLSQDPVMLRLMHGKSAEERNAFLSMLRKDNSAHKTITNDYINHWETDGVVRDGEIARDDRKSKYMSLVNNYYDLVTDLYEEGWAQSFHLCRFAAGESLLQALARHEHYLAHRIGITSDMTVLDVGCGVGKPAREIAMFTGCNVVGLNNNAYQIERATAHAVREHLDHKVSFVKGNFMEINFPENTFDAVYAIEATCHAPTLEGVYSQMFRVLKPGGTCGIYEWVMTDKFDSKNPHHEAIRLGIERGNGISNMVTRQEAYDAILKAGFDIEYHEDLAELPDLKPWYAPLAGELRGVAGVNDFLGYLRMTHLGRYGIGALLRSLELFGLAPPGTARTAAELSDGGDALVAGGKAKLFTPMYLMIAKKPVSS